MASITALQQFDTLIRDTGPTQLTGPYDIINLATDHTYSWVHPLRNNVDSRRIQSGVEIEDRVLFKSNERAEFVGWDDEVTRRRTEQGDFWKVGWRILHTALAWNAQAFDFNPADMTADALGQKYADLWEFLLMDFWTDVSGRLEQAAHEVPDPTEMESVDTGRLPYSYHAAVNEFTNGLFGTGAADAPGGAWTTFQRIDPSLASVGGNWTPRQKGYDGATSNFATGTAAGVYPLLDALEAICLDLRWDRLVMHPGYSEPGYEEGNYPGRIMTQRAGILNLKKAQKVLSDDWSHYDADMSAPEPIWKGMPMEWVELLDTQELYPTDASGGLANYLDTSNSNAGPRYMLMNWRYWNQVFHRDEGLSWYQDEPQEPENQPLSRYQDAFMRCNLICRSRRHQGIVYPTGGNVTNVATI